MTEDREIVLTPAEEAAQRTERRARLKQMENDEREARERQIAIATAQTAGVNEAYFEKQRKLEEEIRNNKPIAIPPKTNADAIAENAARLGPRPSVNPKPVGDPLLDREPEYVQKAQGYTPPKLRPSITLQPRPDPYPSSDPRHGMPRDLILRMGLKP